MEHDDNGAHVAPVVADMHSDPICQGASPAAAAIAAVQPFATDVDLWRAYPDGHSLWLAAMDAGAQFAQRGRHPDKRWECIPPSHALTGDEARAIAWSRQVLHPRTQRSGACLPWFDPRELVMRTWSVDHAATILSIQPRKVWQMVRDGTLGGFELVHGRWQISPASVERYMQRSEPGTKPRLAAPARSAA